MHKFQNLIETSNWPIIAALVVAILLVNHLVSLLIP